MKDLIEIIKEDLEYDSDLFIDIVVMLAEIQTRIIDSRTRFLKAFAYISSADNEDQILDELETMGQEFVNVYDDIRRLLYHTMTLPEIFDNDDPKNPICDYKNLYFSRKYEDETSQI